jgi:hypothetical protein
MKTPLTKWLVSTAVLAAVFAVTAPYTSYGSNPRLVQLEDDPLAPEAFLDSELRITLVVDSNEPAPEIFPFENGKTYLEEEPEEPMPECYGVEEPVLLTDPCEPMPECRPY